MPKSHRQVVKILPHIKEFAVATAKRNRIPLDRLLAEALTTWCRERGQVGVTHHEPHKQLPDTDLRW